MTAPTPTSYDDLDLWQRFRISSYMHAEFTRHGHNRTHLKKAAEDCAGWYSTTTEAVIKVWREVWPSDLRVEIDNSNTERI